VDATWTQAGAIVADPKLAHLPHVAIAEHETLFWRCALFLLPLNPPLPTYLPPPLADPGRRRYNNGKMEGNDEGLATIEAVYHFCRELLEARGKGAAAAAGEYEYNGEADNLLFLFALQYRRIASKYSRYSIRIRAANSSRTCNPCRSP